MTVFLDERKVHDRSSVMVTFVFYLLLLPLYVKCHTRSRVGQRSVVLLIALLSLSWHCTSGQPIKRQLHYLCWSKQEIKIFLRVTQERDWMVAPGRNTLVPYFSWLLFFSPVTESESRSRRQKHTCASQRCLFLPPLLPSLLRHLSPGALAARELRRRNRSSPPPSFIRMSQGSWL